MVTLAKITSGLTLAQVDNLEESVEMKLLTLMTPQMQHRFLLCFGQMGTEALGGLK